MAVAQNLSFTKAAEQMNVAQPAISKQIADLETAIGAQLFVRNRRGTKLTSAGESLLADSRRLFADIEKMKENSRQAARGQTGRLSIGFFGAPVVKFMPRVICNFRTKYPNVAIELHELNPAGQLTAFANNQIQIAFNRPLAEADKDQFETIELFREKLMIAVQGTHRLAKENRVSLKSLAKENFVFVERDQAPGLFDLTVGFCTDCGLTPKIVANPKMMSTALTFIASGVGIGLVPESVQNLNNTGVVFIDTKEHSPPVPLELQWLKANSSATVKALVDMTKGLQDFIKESFVTRTETRSVAMRRRITR